MISRIDSIGIIANHVESDDLMISTTGMISSELFVTEDRPRNFYMLGSMGLASAFGLGLALLNPDQRVVVLEGDGSARASRHSVFVTGGAVASRAAGAEGARVAGAPREDSSGAFGGVTRSGGNGRSEG